MTSITATPAGAALESKSVGGCIICCNNGKLDMVK